MPDGRISGIAAVMEYAPPPKGEVAGLAAVMEYTPPAEGRVSGLAAVMEYEAAGRGRLSGVAAVMEYGEPRDDWWQKVPPWVPGWNNSGYGSLGPITDEELESFWFHDHPSGGRYPNEAGPPDYASIPAGDYAIFSPSIDLSKFTDASRWEPAVETIFHWNRAVTGGAGTPGIAIGYRLNKGAFVTVGAVLPGLGEAISNDPKFPGLPYWQKLTTVFPTAILGESDVQIGYQMTTFGPYTTTDPGPGITSTKLKIREA